MAKKIFTMAMIVSVLSQFFGCGTKNNCTAPDETVSGDELIGEEVLSVSHYITGSPMNNEPDRRNIYIATRGDKLLVVNNVPQKKMYYLPVEEFAELEKFLLKFGEFKKEESPLLFDAPLTYFSFTYLKNKEREEYKYNSNRDMFSSAEDRKLCDIAIELMNELVRKAEESGEEVKPKEYEYY